MNYYDEQIRNHEILYNKMRETLINEQKQANGLYVIDATSELIDGETIAVVNNLPFSKEKFEEQLALVHATNYFPNNHKVLCREDAGVKYQDKCYSHRTTVHTTLNNKVESHGYGNWDNCGYVIIEPLTSQDKSPMGFGKDDTYFSRNINLTDKGLILVNEEKYNQLTDEQKKDNNIMLFKGDSSIATTKALIMMGYKPQYLNDAKGKNNAYDQNEKMFIEYRDEKGYESGKHMETFYQELETNSITRDEFLSEQRKEFINTRSKNLPMLSEEVYKYYEERVLSSDSMHKASFPEFLITNGIIMDQNNNYYALTSSNAIEVAKKYHKSVSRHDINNEKLNEDFKDEYQKLLEIINKKEEDKMMSEILPKNLQDFNEKEIQFSNKMIESILKSNSNDKYGFSKIGKNLQIYDMNGDDELLWEKIEQNNMTDYQVLMNTYLVKKDEFYNKEVPFYEIIKKLNNQINISKEDFNKLYGMQIEQHNGKSYGVSTVSGLMLILGVSISLITVMIMILK